jgi:hypothetical protein
MGVKGIRGRKKPKKKPVLTHRDACFDLAEAKGTRFVEVPLGSKWLNYGGVSQADVITIKPSYNRFNLDIYEVKVTRSDFLQEIKKKKYEASLPHCNRFYFATTSGIAKAEEIPEGIGWIVRGENGWSTVKAAKKRDVEFNQQMMLSLLFFNGRVYNRRREELGRRAYRLHTTTYKEDLKGLGKRIKEALTKYNILERKYNNLLWTASRKIPFKSEKEKEEFEDKWDKDSWLGY